MECSGFWGTIPCERAFTMETIMYRNKRTVFCCGIKYLMVAVISIKLIHHLRLLNLNPLVPGFFFQSSFRDNNRTKRPNIWSYNSHFCLPWRNRSTSLVKRHISVTRQRQDFLWEALMTARICWIHSAGADPAATEMFTDYFLARHIIN